MRVLVTGGAGYVGSVVATVLVNSGYRVIVLDNLQQGHPETVPPTAEFVNADIRDLPALDRVFEGARIDAVIHMAAETTVQHSTIDPLSFFNTNVTGGLNLLKTMLKHDVPRIVFSSTAAVYGQPISIPIEESHPTDPINPYGLSKLTFETILHSCGRAYGIRGISLRYFNAAGATVDLGEHHEPETHLIPNILKAAATGRPVDVHGTDYPTKDGSCVRDYVHVLDIASAHLLALGKIDQLYGRVYNLGSGHGHTVLEVVNAARVVTGVDFPTRFAARRAGDPPVLLASCGAAKHDLGWSPGLSQIHSIIESSWTWLRAHPNGYRTQLVATGLDRPVPHTKRLLAGTTIVTE